MKVNPLLMDVARGEWFMSFSGMQVFAPIAHKILTGQEVVLEHNEPKAFFSIVDDNGKKVSPDANGVINAPKGSVAIVNMIGPVLKYGDWCTYGADEIVKALWLSDQNPNVLGTVVYQDGPGGAVSAAGPFVDFGIRKTKRVEVVADQSASLHYWAACAMGDHISADNNISAMFGSVGIVTSFADNRKYLENLGYVFHEIYPDESQHKNEAFRLALEGKYDLIKKEHMSPIAIQFQNAVRAARPNLKEEVGVLTGKTFGADKALEYGMIDSIGNISDAIQRIHVNAELKLSI